LSSSKASVVSRRARSALSTSGDAAAVARSGAAMLTLTPALRIVLKPETAGDWPAGRLLAREEERASCMMVDSAIEV
jgi:hypothetical protein